MRLAVNIAASFADTPRESQSVFRALMNALARPATLQELRTALAPPSPLTPELAATALALCDADAPLWLDAPLARMADVTAFLRFHTGATIVVKPADAAFALALDPAGLPLLHSFALGTEEFPDRSTTIVIAVAGFDGPLGVTVEGPGLARPATFAPEPLPNAFAEQWRRNRALFPRGVDLVFVGPGQVAALPRSSRIRAEA